MSFFPIRHQPCRHDECMTCRQFKVMVASDEPSRVRRACESDGVVRLVDGAVLGNASPQIAHVREGRVSLGRQSCE